MGGRIFGPEPDAVALNWRDMVCAGWAVVAGWMKEERGGVACDRHAETVLRYVSAETRSGDRRKGRYLPPPSTGTGEALYIAQVLVDRAYTSQEELGSAGKMVRIPEQFQANFRVSQRSSDGCPRNTQRSSLGSSRTRVVKSPTAMER